MATLPMKKLLHQKIAALQADVILLRESSPKMLLGAKPRFHDG